MRIDTKGECISVRVSQIQTRQVNKTDDARNVITKYFDVLRVCFVSLTFNCADRFYALNFLGYSPIHSTNAELQLIKNDINSFILNKY